MGGTGSLPSAPASRPLDREKLSVARRHQAEIWEERAADWRNGPVVYQVLVDRFAPPRDVAALRRKITAPRRLRAWEERPVKGGYLPEVGVWSHEIDFWGGDLEGVRSRLDHLTGLGVEVLYLNPIFDSFTNHKYDTHDYSTIDPLFGSRADLRRLVQDCHRRGLRVILDGVFNHMGRRSPLFQEAQANPGSPWRPFFKWRPDNAFGYVAWRDVENLPELDLAHPRVRDWLYNSRESVVQTWLREDDIDGWRLDVGFDVGFGPLDGLTRAAHAAKAGSLVIGEIWSYPEEWVPSVDGIMNMHGRQVLLEMLKGTIPPAVAARMWENLVTDAGLDAILKGWLVLDNHDTPRLATLLPDDDLVRLGRILQFALPGCPCLYYGSEVGMTGAEDPEMRAPMRWDLVEGGSPLLDLHRRLIALRRAEPALRYGDFRTLAAERLFAFQRRTAWARDTIIVLANPTDRPVREIIQLRDSTLANSTPLVDQVEGKRVLRAFSGTLDVSLAPREALVLKPDSRPFPQGYDRYDRLG